MRRMADGRTADVGLAHEAERVAAVGRRGVVALLTLAGVAGLLFGASSLVQYRCATRGCSPAVGHLWDVEAVGGLPRLFTTAIFLLVAVRAVLGSRTAHRRARTWWSMVAVGGLVLAAAKLVSAHSAFETSDGRTRTLVASLLLTVVALGILTMTARRWSVPGAGPVVVALAVYAAAALGLDAFTAVVEAVQGYVGARSHAVLGFVEEFGEALAALLLLGAVGVGRSRVTSSTASRTGWSGRSAPAGR